MSLSVSGSMRHDTNFKFSLAIINTFLGLNFLPPRKGYLCACGGAHAHPSGRSPRGEQCRNPDKHWSFPSVRLEIARRNYCTAFFQIRKVFQNTVSSHQFAHGIDAFTTLILRCLQYTIASPLWSTANPQFPHLLSVLSSIIRKYFHLPAFLSIPLESLEQSESHHLFSGQLQPARACVSLVRW